MPRSPPATVCRMTPDPDKLEERRRRLAENKERMDARWHQAEVDVAVQELSQIPRYLSTER